MNEIDQLFAGLAAYSEALAKRGEELRERRRLAANARRRDLYAVRKATGTLPPRRPAIEPESEYDAPTDCYCQSVAMPPCGWCEDGCGTADGCAR